MAKFTKDKWHVEGGDCYYSLDARLGNLWYGAKGACNFLIVAEDRTISPVVSNRPEDARLIAAAPTMRNLLQAYLRYKSLFPDTKQRIDDTTRKLLKLIDGEQED